jgi:acetolactate synthase I/II/III large subunit
MDVKTTIAEILRDEGVSFMSCFPENLLIDAFVAAGIRPVVCRSERVVLNVADGYARVAGPGRFGVAVTQYGPGIENAFAGVAQAYGDSVPVLVLPGRRTRVHTTSATDFDAVSNLRGVTKWAAELVLADQVPAVMRKAITALRNGRGGPVLVEVPADIGNAEVDASRSPYRSPKTHRTAPDPADVEEAADVLLRSRRPVILAGQGIHWSQAWDELLELAELLEVPVLTTVNGKSAFPEDHELALGTAGMSRTGMVVDHLDDADLVFAVGTSLRDWWMSPRVPKEAVLIHATLDDRDLNKDHAAHHAIFGDAKLVLSAMVAVMNDRLGSGPPPFEPRRESIRRSKLAWQARWAAKLNSAEVPLNPYRVIAELDRRLDPRTTVVTHDSGNPREQATAFIESRPRSYVGWGNSTQLGYSLGLAMGIKLALPERDVFNVMGDAAFGMTGLDLETAVRNEIGIITILLNNSTMANYDRYMPLAIERHRANRLGGDYADLARALGAFSARVTNPGEIDGAFSAAIASAREGRPALLEFVTCEESAVSGNEPRG